MSYEIINSDCLKAMQKIPDGSVDAIVTDPPYGLEFMGAGWDAPWKSDDYVGKTWNSGMSEVAMADGYKRLKRPSFENTQNVRCRKCGKWKLSSNPCTCAEPDFPNIKLSNMRTFQQYMTPILSEALRVAKPGAHLLCFGGTRTFHRLACSLEDAGWEIRDTIMWVYGSGFPKSMDVGKKLPDWQGWGTCLKPAWEPIIVARKPLDGTVAHNVMTYGTGAINIDGCRIPTSDNLNGGTYSKNAIEYDATSFAPKNGIGEFVQPSGRFPANLVHDGSQEVLELIGDAQRFFYCAKASKRDRGKGNNHPTVKPNALMRWLVRLVCPQGGTVLDPFMGSGSTGVACMQEGMEFVGIDKDKHYCDVADQRMRRELDGGIQRSMF